MGNREKLLRAARECLLSLGYERTTVRHLVAASGANQASISYHFGSQEQLLSTVLRDLNREWADVLFSALGPDPAEGQLSDPLDHEELWKRVIDSIQANPSLWFVNFESLSSARMDDDIRSTILEGQRLARRGLAAAFEGAPSASPEDDSADLVGSYYYSLLVGIAAQAIIDPAG
ncbi:MAG: TetR/AcrR family transcriptional regulator, partial [Microbacterium sp.]|nr:TetR/AcrR family transcriptional regulator [Microbacterium sp.]